MRFEFGGVHFGEASEDLIVESFDHGSHELRTDDKPRAARDGINVGRDFLGGATWAFDLITNQDSAEAALEVASALEAAWKNEELRLTPSLAVPLRYEMLGRWRRVYGRPDKFVGVAGDKILSDGIGEITCDFRLTDHLRYADTPTTARLSIVPASSGGLVAPLVAPLSTTKTEGERVGILRNLGDSSTPLLVEFRGPVVDPYIQAEAGWRIGLNAALAYDDVVVVDARMGTVRKNGQHAAGLLARGTRLSEARLPAGTSGVRFGGIDLTGTAVAALSWRDAFTSL